MRSEERFALGPALGLVEAAVRTAQDQKALGVFDVTARDCRGHALMRRSSIPARNAQILGHGVEAATMERYLHDPILENLVEVTGRSIA